MPFKWLKRRRNTLAADTPAPSLPPPLPSPRHSHFAAQQRGASSATYAHPSTPSTGSTPSEAPKIRRRKSFFQTIGLAKDKDKERKRASSFSAPPPRFDRDAPPVPPLPNGATPIASQFAPPQRLEPAPPRKRKSLIPRKAPPSAWAGDATPAGAPPPVPPIPAAAKPNPPAPLPRTGPLGAVQLDDIRGGELPDSPPLQLGAGQFSALDALDRLDAIGTLDLGSSLTQPQQISRVPPSSFASGAASKRNSIPALDKPLPSPGIAPPATSKRASLDPRASSGAGFPQIDRSVLSPGMSLSADIPALPVKGTRKSVTPETFAPKSASIRTASSSSADTRATSVQSSYRKPPPSNVEIVPLPDILNRPTAGYAAPAGVDSAVSAQEGVEAPKPPAKVAKGAKDMEDAPKPPAKDTVNAPTPVPSRDPELPPIMGGPEKIQATFGSAGQQAVESKEKPQTSRAAESQSGPDARAPQIPPIMGGPAKIQAVWESSHTYREEKAREEAKAREETRTKEETRAKEETKQEAETSKQGDTQAESKPEESKTQETTDDTTSSDDKRAAVDTTPVATGETEEMADDVSEAASDVQPITTEGLGRARLTSTSTWGASTEQLVDRAPSEPRMSFDAPRPVSAFVDRPMSGYDGQFLGTPPRLPSTQTFGNLPGTTTFGALPRPTSIAVPVEEDEDEPPRTLGAVAESETAQEAAHASVPADEMAPTPSPLPVTPPRLPAILPPSPGVPELYTPDATPPSQNIHTPAPDHPEPFKPTRSVSTPSKPQLVRSLTRPESPHEREVQRMPSLGNLRPQRAVTAPVRGADEPSLDDFMTLFRQVQKRGQGVGIRAAAAAAEGRELKERRPYGIGLGQPTTS
ncbi:unnamed protein product [Cutaneotrichosporon oleaginosum]